MIQQFANTTWTSLHAARSKIGISQQKLADICRTKRGLIAYLENGGYSKDAARIINQLKLSVAAYAIVLGDELERIRGILEFRFFRVLEVANVPKK